MTRGEQLAAEIEAELEEGLAEFRKGLGDQYWEVTNYEGVFNGWLSPEGVLYEVHRYGHGKAEASGLKVNHYTWQHLSEGVWNQTPVTQAQLDVIFDWSQANNLHMPALELL